jgi:hypothetical protein
MATGELVGVAPIYECYTGAMPTKLPRHTVTETPDLAAELDAAALEWPDLAGDRTALVRKLVSVGSVAMLSHRDQRLSARAARIRAAAGSATGSFPPNALELLREDWPE